MNLTTVAQTSTGKLIRSQYVLAAAGVVLAASAVIGTVTLRDTSPSPAAPGNPTPLAAPESAPADIIVYIVRSQEEATRLTEGFREANLIGTDPTLRQVIVVDTPAMEAAVSQMPSELFQAAQGSPQAGQVRVIDTR